MRLTDWLSPCLFGHAPDPVTVVRGRVMHHECRRCQADLGPVLPGQKYRARRVKLKKRKSAEVLALARRGERKQA